MANLEKIADIEQLRAAAIQMRKRNGVLVTELRRVNKAMKIASMASELQAKRNRLEFLNHLEVRQKLNETIVELQKQVGDLTQKLDEVKAFARPLENAIFAELFGVALPLNALDLRPVAPDPTIRRKQLEEEIEKVSKALELTPESNVHGRRMLLERKELAERQLAEWRDEP